MNITWKIHQLDRKTENGFVTTAHWICSGVDGEHSASVYATCSFDGQLSIPYDQLTEETVLSWVWKSVGKQTVEEAVAAKIESQKNPVTSTGLPWAASE